MSFQIRLARPASETTQPSHFRHAIGRNVIIGDRRTFALRALFPMWAGP